MQRKPLDVSDGAVCASFGMDGSLLSVGASHQVVGFGRQATAAPVFPDYGSSRSGRVFGAAVPGENKRCERANAPVGYAHADR
jgi:hypothetical protein